MAAKPSVAKLRSEIKPEQLEILAINVGFGDSLEKVTQYIKGHPAPYPVLYDADGDVTKAYQIQGIPLFILVNKDGTVAFREHKLPGDIKEYLQ